eukprot:GHVS01098981.1.p1 GENE.GHVS01098981.1~~GHVS01098981.1.p1  ORF type:complete len:369 (+),score=69.54 GHVS01098981.1:101-1207(+)
MLMWSHFHSLVVIVLVLLSYLTLSVAFFSFDSSTLRPSSLSRPSSTPSPSSLFRSFSQASIHSAVAKRRSFIAAPLLLHSSPPSSTPLSSFPSSSSFSAGSRLLSAFLVPLSPSSRPSTQQPNSIPHWAFPSFPSSSSSGAKQKACFVGSLFTTGSSFSSIRHQQQPSNNTSLAVSRSVSSSPQFLIGHGYDIHRMSPLHPSSSSCSSSTSPRPSPLIIAGVPIECDVGVIAHSDGDVVLHSVCDAIFGALGLPDIGEHFPDTDERWMGQSSDLFVKEAKAKMEQQGWTVANCDITLILEKPKMKNYRERMRERLRELLGTQLVNLKARTHEKVDAVGRQEAVECHAVVLLERTTNNIRNDHKSLGVR